MIRLDSKITKSVLGYFFMNPKAELYLSELASLLALDPSNLSKKLKELEREGLFTSEVRGKERYYRINREYPLYNAYKKVYEQYFGIERELGMIIDDMRDIDQAYLFGSYAKGQFDASSDIDLLIIGTVSAVELNKRLLQLEKKYQRDINFIIMTTDELEEKRESNDMLTRDIFNGPTKKLKP